MQFLIDASMPRDVAKLFLAHGHQALDVRDIGLRHSQDAEIAEHSRSHKQVYDSNLRLRIERSNLCTYAGLSVYCDQPEPDPIDPNGETFINPSLIVEVLAPPTASYDRGDKFHHYLQLESLQEYVIVTQSHPRVDVYFRRSDASWLFTPSIGLESRAKLFSLQIELPLSDVYAGIEFPSA